MASLKSLPSWVVALGAGAASVPVVGPWISGAVTHRYLGPTVVAVVALVIGGLGKLATDLLGHIRPRLVAWLELLLVRWFSRFGPWYRRVVLTDSRTMGREGFGGLVARGLDLDAVYVDVSLVSRAPRSASPHLVRDGRNEGDRRQDLTGYLSDADQAVLVVLGGPGSGKSTLLRRIARQTYLDPKPHGHRIPIFLALREHVATIVADPAIRLSTVVGHAKAPLLTGGTVPGLLAPEPRRTDALVAWFENLLVAGRCVILLDGLDEVATEGERSAIVTWANTQILRYAQHGNHYVLSSRPDGYRAGGLDDAAVLEVEPFTTEQVNAFVVDAYAVGSAGWDTPGATTATDGAIGHRAAQGDAGHRGAGNDAGHRGSGDNGSHRAGNDATGTDATGTRATRDNSRRGHSGADSGPGVARRWSLRRVLRRAGSREVVRRGASRAAAQRAADLSRQLGEASRLRPLTRNPLLLTMLFFVHRDRGSLPSSRLELYRQICRTVLEDRQKDKRIAVPLPVEQAELLLSGLALAMTREGRATTWTRDQVLDQLGPHVRALPVTAEDFLDLAGLHGLFVESGIGRYAFTHRTFQEYLAAVALAAAPPETLPVEDPWWHETLLFYAMLTGPNAVLRECLRSETVTAWALAFDCAEHATDAQPLEPDLALRLEQLLVTPGANSSLRRLFAGVLATRHLRDVVHTARDQAICARLVPARLYELFQHDTSENLPLDPALVPAGPDAADTPVLGVLGGTAAEFVDWVNAASGGPQCRLPTPAEAAASEIIDAAAPDAPSLWTVEVSGTAPDLWTPPGRPHPWMVPVEELQRLCDEDLTDPKVLAAQLLLARILADWRNLSSAAYYLDRAGGPDPTTPLPETEIVADVDLARHLLRDIDSRFAPLISDPWSTTVGTDLAKGTGPVPGQLLAAYADLAARGGTLSAALAPTVGELQRSLDQKVGGWKQSELRHGDQKTMLDRGRRAVIGRRATDALDDAVRQAHQAVNGNSRNWMAATLFGLSMGQVPEARTRPVAPGELAATTRQACRELPELVAWGVRHSWAGVMCQRLEAAALPVFGWQRPVTGELGTRIRLLALSLADETEHAVPDLHQDARAVLAERFRDLAFGVTLLELRERGTVQPTEAILLAVD